MNKIKTCELIGPALDWAVSQCYGVAWGQGDLDAREYGPGFRPSTEWDHGGPIIHRELRTLEGGGDDWFARSRLGFISYGPTPLIAAMRCLVATRFGTEVEIPEELMDDPQR